MGNRCYIDKTTIYLINLVSGENSIIGAGAVVTKNVGRNQVMVGNPAKLLRRIND